MVMVMVLEIKISLSQDLNVAPENLKYPLIA